MRTRDDSSLEKFLHINVTIPDLDFEKWQIYFTTTTSRAIAGLPEEASFKNAATIGRLINLIRPLLGTPRLLKSFGRHLFEKVRSPARYVEPADIYGLCTIEATNPRLYSWIAANRHKLLKGEQFDPPKDAVWGPDKTLTMGEQMKEPAARQERLRNLLASSVSVNEEEIRLMDFLFLRKSYAHSHRRITNSEYFANYFYRDRLPQILTPPGEQAMFRMAKRGEEESLAKHIQEQIENQRDDLKEAIIARLESLIKRDQEGMGDKLLIAYGILARNLPYEDIFISIGKTRASHVVSPYLLNNKLKEKQLTYLLKTIASNRTSDSFLAVAAQFYRESKNLDACRILAGQLHVRLVVSEKEVKNIYAAEVSDAPNSLLFGWRHAANFEAVNDYLDRLFETSPTALNSFLQHYAQYAEIPHSAHSASQFIAPSVLEKHIVKNLPMLRSKDDQRLQELITEIYKFADQQR